MIVLAVNPQYAPFRFLPPWGQKPSRLPAPMRFAVIDLGFDAIQLGVVEADTSGNQRLLAREQASPGLGRGVLRTGLIQPTAFQSGLEALAWMAALVERHACTSLTAQGGAVLRTAANAGTFIDASAKLGIPLQVISGEEESRLLYEAVRHALPLPEEPAVLIGIEGGSTTLVWTAGARILASLQLPWGPQNLAEAMPTADPPGAEDLKRVRRSMRRLLKKAQRQLPEGLPSPGIGLGAQGWLPDLLELSGPGPDPGSERLLRLHRKAWRTGAQERAAHLGLEPGLAGVLHLGTCWTQSVLDWLGVSSVQALPVGRREGLLRMALKRAGASLPARRWAAVESLAARLDPDPDHSRHVGRLADQLFGDLRSELGLGDLERELLGCAARLHDIGLALAAKDHHKHGACLLQNAGLAGFRPREVELMAQLVRFHRGRAPSAERHEDHARLPPWHRATVEKLAAILRAADALDRGHRQAVQSVRMRLERDACQIHLQGTGDLRLELEGLQEKGALLFRLLDRPVRTLVSTGQPKGLP